MAVNAAAVISAMFFGYLVLWISAVFMTAVLFASAAMIICSALCLRCRILPEKYIYNKNEKVNIILECRNSSPFIYLKTDIRYSNGVKCRAAVFRGTNTFASEYSFKRKGFYTVGTGKITVRDVFGIFRHKIRVSGERICVLPRSDAEDVVKAEKAGGRTYSDAVNKPEGDQNMISYLRGYRYGDTLNRINWKATAGKNSVIVNQYEDEQDFRVLVFAECSDDPDTDDAVCDKAYTCVRDVLERKGAVTLMRSADEASQDSSETSAPEEYGVYLAKHIGKVPGRSTWTDAIDRTMNTEREGYDSAVLFIAGSEDEYVTDLVKYLTGMDINVSVQYVTGGASE